MFVFLSVIFRGRYQRGMTIPTERPSNLGQAAPPARRGGGRTPAARSGWPYSLIAHRASQRQIARYAHHVGLYIGGSLMIDAPDFGQVVKSEPYQDVHV